MTEQLLPESTNACPTSPTTDQPELLPCPFCGGEGEAVCLRASEDVVLSWVRCLSCAAQTDPIEGAYSDLASARATWNTRLTSAAPTLGDMVMVPREPTEAMVAAWENACPKEGWDAIPEMNDADANAAIAGAEWSAMLAAAPVSLTPPGPW